jgi:hypothetical protein
MDHRIPGRLTGSIRQFVVHPEQAPAFHEANQHQEEDWGDESELDDALAGEVSVT